MPRGYSQVSGERLPSRAMPLHLDKGSISRIDGRALWRQLADLIVAAVATGDLQPDEALPAEGEIAAQTALSTTTVRAALAQLAQEGRVVKRAGMPTRVAIPPPIRHMATSRYARELAILRKLAPGEPHPELSAFTDDHGIAWDAYSVQAEYTEDGADTCEAGRLDIAPGTAVLRRQLVKIVHGRPAQIQDSVIPLALVRGTPVADPSRQPWPGGTIAELSSIGIEVTAVTEEARARTATTAEREALRMEAPGPVLDIVRVFLHQDSRPVEVSTVIVPAAGVTLAWETTLS